MATEAARGRARAEIARLARADLDNDGFRLAAAGELVRKASPAWQSRHPVTILSAATGGDLHRSKLWRDLLGPRGAGDDMQVRLAAGGAMWAHLDLGREQSSRWFAQDDADFMAGLAPLLAARLRAGLRTPASPAEDGSEPGTLILDRDLGLVGATGAAWRWIDRLGLQRPSDHEPLPGFIYAAVTRIAAPSHQRQAPIAVRLQATALAAQPAGDVPGGHAAGEGYSPMPVRLAGRSAEQPRGSARRQAPPDGGRNPAAGHW